MNKNELQNKLNDMLVGKSAYLMHKLSDYVKDHLGELGIDNTQGEWRCGLYAYSIQIIYKSWVVVSCEIKRVKHKDYVWAVKQVVLDENFVDLESKMKDIHARYERDIERFNEWNVNYSSMQELKELLSLIKQSYKGKNKLDIKNLIYDLNYHYWLVDEAVDNRGLCYGKTN